MEFLAGLIGALIGGIFVLGGSFLQGQLQAKQVERRFEHERKLAAEDHARRQAERENEALRARLQHQIGYGRRVLIAASRFQDNFQRPMNALSSKPQTPYDILVDAVKFAGLNWNEPAPYAAWIHPNEFEDQQLSKLVDAHRELVAEVDMALIHADARPNELPENCTDILERVDGIARQIDGRCRWLQREGKPL